MESHENLSSLPFSEFELLARKNLPSMFSVAFALTQDYFESESICESAFAKAYRKRSLLSEMKPQDTSTWLIGQAAMLSSKYLASKRFEKRMDDAQNHLGSPTIESALTTLGGVTGLVEKLSRMRQRQSEAAYSYYILSESILTRAKRAKIPFLRAKADLKKAREAIRADLLNEVSEAE